MMFKTIRKMMVFALAVSAMQVFGGDDLAEYEAALREAKAKSAKKAKSARLMASPSSKTQIYEATGELGVTKGSGTLTFSIDVTKEYSRIKSALLVIDAYDVDYPCATEHDQVFFNGSYMGRLYGDNNQYSADYNQSFNRFPIPTSSVRKGLNSLIVYVNVDNGGWVTNIRSARLEITGSDPDVPAIEDIVSPYFDGERGTGGGRPAWFLSGVNVDVPITIKCDAGETEVVGYKINGNYYPIDYNQSYCAASSPKGRFEINFGKIDVGSYSPGYKMEVKLKGANDKWSEPFVANFYVAEQPNLNPEGERIPFRVGSVSVKTGSILYVPIVDRLDLVSTCFGLWQLQDQELDFKDFKNLKFSKETRFNQSSHGNNEADSLLKWEWSPKIEIGCEMDSSVGIWVLSADAGADFGVDSYNVNSRRIERRSRHHRTTMDNINLWGADSGVFDRYNKFKKNGLNKFLNVGEFEVYAGLIGSLDRRWDDHELVWKCSGGSGGLHFSGQVGVQGGLPHPLSLVSVGGNLETDIIGAIHYDNAREDGKCFLTLDGTPFAGFRVYGQIGLSAAVAIRGGYKGGFYWGIEAPPWPFMETKRGYKINPYWEFYFLGSKDASGEPQWGNLEHWWVGAAFTGKSNASRYLSASVNNFEKSFDVKVRNKSGYQTLERNYTSETEIMSIEEVQSVRPRTASRLKGASLLSAGSQNVIEEDALITSGYPMPAPTTATSASGDAVAFLRDNVSRGAVDRTELVVQRNVDGKWKAADSVWNDGTADFAPSMATLADGTIIVVWQNLKQTYGETIDIEQMMSDSEIAVATRNPSTGAWSHKSLTSNAVVDHSPKVAVAPDGGAMVVWIRNDGNEILGTAEHPDKLYYARYANGAWGNETLLPTEGCTMLSTDIAMSQNGAIVTYTADMDGTLEAGTDQELFAVTINGSSVNNVRITNDELTDIRGSVRIGNDGEPVFVWSSAGTVVWKNGWLGATNSVLTNATKVVTDFSVSPVAPDGKIAIAFSSDGAEGMHTDPYLLVYDPVTQQWGEGLRIVENVAYEGNYSPAWDANGNVFMSYASYNTEKDANDYVQTKSADVKTIRFPIGADPAISTDDIYFTTNVLTVGEVVHVEAVIRNKGTLAARNVGVTVKDAISGTVFSGTIAEIPGGGEYVYGFDWTVGDSIMSDLLDFEFTLTPDAASIDKDVSNNHVHWRGPEANVGIASAFAREQETNSKLLCARVRNLGFRKSTEGMKVTFRRGSANGTVLGDVDVPALNSGRENEFEARYSWDLSGLTFETNMVEMVAVLSDEKGAVVETFPFTVEVKSLAEEEPVEPKEPLYMVVDLSGGTNAVHFPISFLDDVPQGGWTDEYKTEKLVLRRIEAGTFTMGSPEDELGHYRDELQHQVTLTKPFYAGVFEFTKRQWELVMGDRVGSSSWWPNEDAQPANGLSWYDLRGNGQSATWPETSQVAAESFFGVLRRKTGVAEFDLPTDAQWEYACRAGTTTAFNNGKSISAISNDVNLLDIACYRYNKAKGYWGSSPVGSFNPNAWGLYDMHGNVWEWCLDWASKEGISESQVDPVGLATSEATTLRRIRSSGYDSYAVTMRSAYKNCQYPDSRGNGFRVFCVISDTLVNMAANKNVSVHVALVGDDTEFSDYQVGQMFGTLPTPTSKNGLPFLGWFTSDGTQVTPTTIVTIDHAQLFAKWDYSSTMEWKIQNEGGTYMVIDLSGGPNASNYPISYLDDVPVGGWTDEYKTTKLVLRRISAGSGLIGSLPFTLTKDYYIGVFELTQKQWELVMGGVGNHLISDWCIGDTYPMYSVAYEDVRGNDPQMKWPKSAMVPADCFLGRLRAKTGVAQFDLPTRSQWYHACGSEISEFNSDEYLQTLAWCAENSDEMLHCVGLKAPNGNGLYDIYGNANEWGIDWVEPFKSDTDVDTVGGVWDFDSSNSVWNHFWVYPLGGTYRSTSDSLMTVGISSTSGFYVRGMRLCLTTGGHVIYDAPEIYPKNGLQEFPMTVSLANPNLSGTVVYYTIDGSEPSVTNGILYTGSFELNEPATVKAFVHGISGAFKARDSLVATGSWYDSISRAIDVDCGVWTTRGDVAWLPDENGSMICKGLTNGQYSAISALIADRGMLEFDVDLRGDGEGLPVNSLYLIVEDVAAEDTQEILIANQNITNNTIRIDTTDIQSDDGLRVTLRFIGSSPMYTERCYFDQVRLSNVKWSPQEYVITLDRNDGSGVSFNVIAHYKGEMPVAEIPYRPGYTFVGYFDAVEGGTQYYSATMASAKVWDRDADVTLYARWIANAYKVTLESNWDGGGRTVLDVAYGDPLPSARAPQRYGYDFLGYYDTPMTHGGTQFLDSNMNCVHEWEMVGDGVLYARWRVRAAVVEFNPNGGVVGEKIRNVQYNTHIGDLPVPDRDGYLFIGWFTLSEGGERIYGSTIAYYDIVCYAHWLSNSSILVNTEASYETSGDGSFSLALGELVLSASTPKLTLKGLPSGLKYDSKTMTISGKATKPGVYTVTVSATNATVKKPVTATFEIFVPNLTSERLPGLEPDRDAYGVVRCGVAFDPDFVDCSPEAGWSVKVSGLPAGLKYDTKTGKIVGIPTKAGTFTVTFTASKKGEKSQTATITLETEALPDWATGAFAGFVKDGDDYGSATMTVTANGKVSGKIALVGTNWTFSAASYAVVDDGAFVVEAEAKAGKATRPLSVEVREHAGAEPLANALAAGSFGGGTATLLRNIWKDKATAAEAKAVIVGWEGVYTLSFMDGGYLSLTVGKNGDVKASGKLSDGTSVSATAPLMHNDCWDGFFTVFCVAPSAYKGGFVLLPVGFGAERGRLGEIGAAAAMARNRNPQATGEYGEGFGRQLYFTGAYYDKAKNLNEYYEALRFATDVPELAYGFKRTYLDGNNRKATVQESMVAGAADTLWQEGCMAGVGDKGALVVAKATKPVQDKETKEWSYGGANDGALSLSFTQATGIFKGSYTFWFDYMSAYDETTDKATMAHTSKKVSFEGVVVQGDESLRGFYLWDATGSYEDPKTGKEKTYKYKESFPVSLLSE